MGVTELRQNLADILDSVVDDVDELVVTSARGREPVVVVPLREYNSLLETAYLQSSPANARRLSQAIRDLDAGVGEHHELIDPDDTQGAA